MQKEIRGDPTYEMSNIQLFKDLDREAPRSGAIHLERYRRFNEGESVPEIAEKDGVKEATVVESINQGRQMEKMAAQRKITEIRLRGALENEKLREKLRQRLGDHLINAYEEMLKGEFEVMVGENAVMVKNPNIMLKAAAEVRAAISLAEKPAAAQTSIVNVQQSNTSVRSDGSLDFESLAARIRSRQSEPEAIDVEPESEEEEWELDG